MKTERQIRDNLNAKLGIWKSGHNREERLKEHIRMLDWVLNDGYVRDIDDIMKG